jgi:hypothetical protein
MEVMRKEIARLNEIIAKGCLSGKAQVSHKEVDEAKRPKFKEGRHPSIKHGLGHIAGAKSNGRKIINGYECVQFERKGKIGTDRPACHVIIKHGASCLVAHHVVHSIKIIFICVFGMQCLTMM